MTRRSGIAVERSNGPNACSFGARWTAVSEACDAFGSGGERGARPSRPPHAPLTLSPQRVGPLTAAGSAHARWTRQNKRNRIGRYRFVLAAAWDTRTRADGRYVVEVTASDVSGNTMVARFPVQVANRGARV